MAKKTVHTPLQIQCNALHRAVSRADARGGSSLQEADWIHERRRLERVLELVRAKLGEARREYRGVEEAYSLPLPAVVTVKEGINLPRYPSLPGRLRAKRAAVERSAPAWAAEGLRKQALRVPPSSKHQAAVLGHGVDAVPELVRVLDELGVLP